MLGDRCFQLRGVQPGQNLTDLHPVIVIDFHDANRAGQLAAHFDRVGGLQRPCGRDDHGEIPAFDFLNFVPHRSGSIGTLPEQNGDGNDGQHAQRHNDEFPSSPVCEAPRRWIQLQRPGDLGGFNGVIGLIGFPFHLCSSFKRPLFFL